MAKAKKGESIVKNIDGIALGIVAIIWMFDVLIKSYRYGSAAYFIAFTLGLVAVFFIIYNVRSIRKKRAAGANKAKSKPTTSRPRPRAGSAAGGDEAFISEIQEGRCYDLFARHRLGVAELYVAVDYEDGVYYIKPEIEVTYDSGTVRTQSDVDTYDDVVVNAYQKQFDEMVALSASLGGSITTSPSLRSPRILKTARSSDSDLRNTSGVSPAKGVYYGKFL